MVRGGVGGVACVAVSDSVAGRSGDTVGWLDGARRVVDTQVGARKDSIGSSRPWQAIHMHVLHVRLALRVNSALAHPYSYNASATNA